MRVPFGNVFNSFCENRCVPPRTHCAAFICSFFMGSLSDKFGKKPLIFLPLLGSVLDAILHMINYTFIRELPMEFFYLISMYKFLGGTPIFYLGVYSYGVEISKENGTIL